MRPSIRTPVTLALASMLIPVLAFVPTGAAGAAESAPALQWPAVAIRGTIPKVVTSPTGSVTIPCTHEESGGTNLRTYDSTGRLVQDIPRIDAIDGVENCLNRPAVDKNSVVYGIPYGRKRDGSWAFGSNLLAYRGNTLKWKYPISALCGETRPVVGANGNIYTSTHRSDGIHLIGVKPNLSAGKTQPSKVLDIKVPGLRGEKCSPSLFAYKDGIMLFSGEAGYNRPQFYSYTGTYLGRAPTGYLSDQKLNAEGQLFTPKYGTWQSPGETYAIGVSKYDFRRGAVAWSTQVSTPGAAVKFVSIYPFKGGGAVAVI